VFMIVTYKRVGRLSISALVVLKHSMFQYMPSINVSIYSCYCQSVLLYCTAVVSLVFSRTID